MQKVKFVGGIDMKMCNLEPCTEDENVGICCAECSKGSSCAYACEHLKRCEYVKDDVNEWANVSCLEYEIKREDVIKGLKDLKLHCESMHSEEGDQWDKDVEVLKKAIYLINQI